MAAILQNILIKGSYALVGTGFVKIYGEKSDNPTLQKLAQSVGKVALVGVTLCAGFYSGLYPSDAEDFSVLFAIGGMLGMYLAGKTATYIGEKVAQIAVSGS